MHSDLNLHLAAARAADVATSALPHRAPRPTADTGRRARRVRRPRAWRIQSGSAA